MTCLATLTNVRVVPHTLHDLFLEADGQKPVPASRPGKLVEGIERAILKNLKRNWDEGVRRAPVRIRANSLTGFTRQSDGSFVGGISGSGELFCRILTGRFPDHRSGQDQNLVLSVLWTLWFAVQTQIFVCRTVWGTETLIRMTEDGSWVTVDYTTFTIPVGATLRFIYRFDFRETDLKAWQRHLTECKIIQVVNQVHETF